MTNGRGARKLQSLQKVSLGILGTLAPHGEMPAAPHAVPRPPVTLTPPRQLQHSFVMICEAGAGSAARNCDFMMASISGVGCPIWLRVGARALDCDVGLEPGHVRGLRAPRRVCCS